MVQLLKEDGIIMGFGVLDTNFTCGVELHQMKLRPYKVAIRVTHALDERKWISELLKEFFGDCVNKVI